MLFEKSVSLPLSLTRSQAGEVVIVERNVGILLLPYFPSHVDATYAFGFRERCFAWARRDKNVLFQITRAVCVLFCFFYFVFILYYFIFWASPERFRENGLWFAFRLCHLPMTPWWLSLCCYRSVEQRGLRHVLWVHKVGWTRPRRLDVVNDLEEAMQRRHWYNRVQPCRHQSKKKGISVFFEPQN